MINMNWIPCRERLPESAEPEILCLVTYQDYDVSEGKYGCRKLGIMSYLTKHRIWNTKALIRVLAWMPLPELYKEQKKMVDFDTRRTVMSKPFSIAVHKNTFIDYLEIILDESGEAHYAVPSHQEWLIKYGCKKFNISKETFESMCPPEMHFNYIEWLTKFTECVAVWDIEYVGSLNRHQKAMLELLKLNGLYKGEIL